MKREDIKSKIRKIFKENKVEMLIAFLATCLSGFAIWRAYSQGSVLSGGDASSHLNFARLIFDSMTPGISQAGFWPPLLHILMAPFTAIDFLYYTGLAGFAVLYFCLIAGSILLYRVSVIVTENKYISIVACLVFLLNPYVLYFTTTPMMEVLFLANLIAVAYFMALWIKIDKIIYLLICGCFVSLLCLSRFEGLILIPVVSAIAVIHFIKKYRDYYRIEASFILFLILALLGLSFLLIYSWVYSGDYLRFAGSGSTWHMLNAVNISTKGDLLLSLKYLLHASYYMVGKSLVFLSIISFMFLLVLPLKNKFISISILVILMSPIFLTVITMFRGGTSIWIPELYPFDKYQNVRYGLALSPFAALSPVLLIGLLDQKINTKKRLLKYCLIAFSTIILTLSLQFFYSVTFKDNYRAIIGDMASNKLKKNNYIAHILKDNYDYGKILGNKYFNDQVFIEAKIPLSNYIYEGNYLYYQQALDKPWFFARWVYMNNPRNNSSTNPIGTKWGESELFNRYYVLIAENEKYKVYKINESAVKKLAEYNNYNLSQIPSINSNIRTWRPETIYGNIGALDNATNGNEEEVILQSSVKLDLIKLYDYSMEADYQEGFYLGKDNVGTSETQSYMLMQSYIADDQETFEKTWVWTKANIQRKEDHLFAWQFKSVNGKTEIIDANPAADADEDIAFALIKAGEKWSKPEYIEEGKKIANDLWNIETAELNGKRYVTGGNWANTEANIVINPSYFSPFAYRLFAKYDTGHDWNKLTDDGYEFLDKASEANLNEGLKMYLPPNWISIDKKTGKLEKFNGKASSFDYSYDAFRVFWRVAVDYKVNHTDKAKAYLEKIKVFDEEWSKNGKVCSLYEMKSSVGECKSVITTMAGPLSVFYVVNPDIADKIVNKYYAQDGKIAFANDMSFYDRSWYWFGLVLWSETEF